MKANEIRVLNVFMGYDDKLFSWSLKEFSFIESYLSIDIDEIIKSPVILDEEILLKCGFEKRKESSGYVGYKINDFEVGYSGNGFYYSATNREGEGNEPVVDLSCLHHLQNLYFTLTGIELDTSKIL